MAPGMSGSKLPRSSTNHVEVMRESGSGGWPTLRVISFFTYMDKGHLWKELS
jgi:hypothetical protein